MAGNSLKRLERRPTEIIQSMNRTSVSSSNLRSIGYDSATNTLEIAFHGGRVYQYFNVPKSVYHGLMNAASHGKYHHRRIKDRYPYERIR
jgi:hypothetical protein